MNLLSYKVSTLIFKCCLLKLLSLIFSGVSSYFGKKINQYCLL